MEAHCSGIRNQSFLRKYCWGVPSSPTENSLLPLPSDVCGMCLYYYTVWDEVTVECSMSLSGVRVLKEHSLHLTGRQPLLRKQPSPQTDLGLNLMATTSWLCGFGWIASPLWTSASSIMKWACWHHRNVGRTKWDEGPQSRAWHTVGAPVFLAGIHGNRKVTLLPIPLLHPSPNPVPLYPFTLLYYFIFISFSCTSPHTRGYKEINESHLKTNTYNNNSYYLFSVILC